MSKSTPQLSLLQGAKATRDGQALGIMFHFGGKVVTLPSQHSMPLCHAFGHSFFIERSPSDNDPAIATLPIPAWMVPKNPDTENNTQLCMATAKKEVQVTFAGDKHEYNNATKSFEKQSRIVKLQVPYLELSHESIEKDNEGLIVNSAKLVRPGAEWDEEMATRVSEAKKAIKDATKKRKKDAPSGGGDQAWEKIAGHLLK